MTFDYAISFSGQDREIAREISIQLKSAGFRIFFDEDFEHELLGKDGVDFLNEIFFKKSNFCIALLSSTYEKSAWTKLEKKAIQARKFINKPGYLIPVLINGYHPDWLLPTRIYYDLNKRGKDKLIEFVTNKVRDVNQTRRISTKY